MGMTLVSSLKNLNLHFKCNTSVLLNGFVSILYMVHFYYFTDDDISATCRDNGDCRESQECLAKLPKSLDDHYSSLEDRDATTNGRHHYTTFMLFCYQHGLE